MELSIVAVTLPIVYAALQIEALRNMFGRWKRAAYLPLALMMAGFVGQFYVVLLAPGFVTSVPTTGLAIAVAYLIGLHIIHAVATRHSWTDTPEWDAAPREKADIVELSRYRDAERAEI